MRVGSLTKDQVRLGLEMADDRNLRNWDLTPQCFQKWSNRANEDSYCGNSGY